MHPLFNVPKGVVIDVLHCVFLGVILTLAKHWFHQEHSSMDYSIKDKVSLVLSLFMHLLLNIPL